MWTKLVDLELDDQAICDMATPMAIPVAERHTYPYGLRICLTKTELDKLGLDADCNIGDMLDMRCFGEVTSISKDGDNCRVEIQIQKIAVENEAAEATPGPKRNPLHTHNRS